ncbi:zinc ribbon domain-containing protein [Gemmatimonadota bacterium]
MSFDPQEVLRRFHRALLREIRAANPEYLNSPFTVAEIYQHLVPYRTHRDELGVEMNADYEHALLRLLAGEGDYLTIESRSARQEIREELDSPNPNTGLYRDFAAADVRLNPEKVDEGLGADGPMASSEGEEGEPEGSGDREPESEEVVTEDDPVEVSEEGLSKESAEVVGSSEGGEDQMNSEEEAVPDEEVQEEGGGEADPAMKGTPDTCPWCRESLPDRLNMKFCPFCGSNVQLAPCPECGEELELDWRFCIACGTEVSS